MLDFSDKPYQFFPPKPNSLVIAIAKQLNRRFVLPGKKHRIKQIELRHADRILPLISAKHRLLLLPNHSTHSDPQMMLEVQRRLRINAATMAAYDVFLRGKFQAWFMQSIGCFSIDREGSDKLAMNCAIDTLIKGERALTIFPEGNVLLMNDRVSPFLGGAAFIGMRAQKKLGPEKPIYAVPISMHFSQLDCCRERVEAHADDLEKQLDIEGSEASMRQRFRQIGLQILSRNLRQRGYVPPSDDDTDLAAKLEASVLQIIEKLEQKIEMEPGSGPPIERVRRIRSTIHQIRIDESKQLDHRVAATWADEAILALRILSYSSDYLQESPTLDRHCETLEKLREDLAEKILKPIGDRNVVVQFGEPINLAEHLGGNSRKVLAGLTTQFEASVQAGLDEINVSIETEGAKAF